MYRLLKHYLISEIDERARQAGYGDFTKREVSLAQQKQALKERKVLFGMLMLKYNKKIHLSLN